jgi:hypothetical protein
MRWPIAPTDEFVGVWIPKHEYDKAIADDSEAIRLAPDYAGTFYSRGFDVWVRSSRRSGIARR